MGRRYRAYIRWYCIYTQVPYRAAAAEAGRTPFICLMRDAVIANSMAEAEAASGPTM
jgi:hypothetical protein